MSKLERRTFAQELTTRELPLVTVSFLRHVRVFDYLAVASYTTLDGDVIEGRQPHGQYAELGGFVIEARATADWDAILDLLVELESTQPDYFHRLMRKCVALSDGPREADGFHELLDDHDQAIFDVAAEREARREEQGYVSLGDARAFLESARRAPLVDIARQVPGLVRAASASRFELVRAFLEQHPDSEADLAQLANTLISGCSLQGRAFLPPEARDGALAICNLGLELTVTGRSLIAAFQTGFAVLHQRVCMRTARRLADVIGGMDCRDRDIQFQLLVLKRELLRAIEEGRPWKARSALDVLVMLDAPSWAALDALLDECPVMHAAIGASGRQPIAAEHYEFISRSVQLPRIEAFLDALPSALTN